MRPGARTTIAAAALALMALAGCATNPPLADSGNAGATSSHAGSENGTAAGGAETSWQTRGGLSAVLTRVGDTAAATGSYATAVRMYRRAHELAPGRIEAALGLARASAAVKDHQSAADAYRSALEIDPDRPEALSGLGRELMNLQAPRQAIPYLRRAIERRREAWVHNELGVAHEMVGAFDAAQDQYRLGLELAPRDLSLRTNLGRAIAIAGDYDTATGILRSVTADPAADRRHRQALALVYVMAGERSSAAAIAAADYGPEAARDRIGYYALLGKAARYGNRNTVAREFGRLALRDVSSAAPSRTGAAALVWANSAPVAVPRNTTTEPMTAPANGSRVPPPRATDAASRPPISLHQAVAVPAPPSPPPAAANGVAHASPNAPPISLRTSNAIDANTAPALIDRPRAGSAVRPPFAYQVQLAAFRTPKRAELGWTILGRAAPEMLAGLGHVVRPPNPDYAWDRLYRLRTLAFRDRGPARALCTRLKARALDCLVVRTANIEGLAFERSPNPAPAGSRAAIEAAARPSVAALPDLPLLP